MKYVFENSWIKIEDFDSEKTKTKLKILEFLGDFDRENSIFSFQIDIFVMIGPSWIYEQIIDYCPSV